MKNIKHHQSRKAGNNWIQNIVASLAVEKNKIFCLIDSVLNIAAVHQILRCQQLPCLIHSNHVGRDFPIRLFSHLSRNWYMCYWFH
jgi:hypothetical protein